MELERRTPGFAQRPVSSKVMVLKQPSLPSAGATKLSDVYKEPIWDVILSYMSVISFLLSILTIGGELFFPDLSCFPPTNVSRTQAPFINSWCSNAHLGKVSTLPLALLGQSMALYTPSLLFYHCFFRKIRQFFIEVKELDRHRNSTSGTYSRESLNVVRLLRDQFESSKFMQKCYAVKLIAQGVLALLFVGILAWLGANSIVEDQFTCPVQIVTEPMWSVEVGCVYPAASTLALLWAANFAILSVAILFACIGFFWNICSKTVDYTKTARHHYYFGTTIEPVYKSKCCSVPDDLCLLHRLLFHFDFGIGQSFEELLIILELMDLKHSSYCDILDLKEAVSEHLTTVRFAYTYTFYPVLIIVHCLGPKHQNFGKYKTRHHSTN
ncbi:hypothetical protein [Candidatus Rhodobacter oscarellae]|uniref:hypothetical protein n=1 Tax=Candidatus Rhodobacter oscarellae TaxID=1675527 RepID=UPI000A98D268|nr:hypothetical protein [Candidatus Rhodobacter lobularis]